jgi:hypothetical protein
MRFLAFMIMAIAAFGCSKSATVRFSIPDPSVGGGAGAPGPVRSASASYKAYAECGDQEIKVAPTAPKRLSKEQYIAYVVNLFSRFDGGLVSWGSRRYVLFERIASGSLATALARVPPDYADRTYSRLDSRFTEDHLAGYFTVADAISEHFLNSNPTAFNAMLSYAGPSCTTASSTEACTKGFMRYLARHLLVRPLDLEEENRYWAQFQAWTGTSAEKFATLLKAMLVHPDFLFLIQNRGVPAPGGGGWVQKTPYETVRQLALHYRDSPPPDAAFNRAAAAAAGGVALNVQDAVGDIFGPYIGGSPTENNNCAPGSNCDPAFPLSESQQVLARFLEEYLEFTLFPGFSSDPVSVQASQPEQPTAGNANYLGGMRADIQTLGFRNFWTGQSFDRFLNDRDFWLGHSSFLNGIYGFPSGSNPPSGQPRQLTGRSGALTRMGFVASGTPYANQIMLGTKVLRKFLCRTIPDPNPADLPEGFRAGQPRHQPPISSREYVANQTSGASCIGCHSVINPVGSLFGGYDGIGRRHLTPGSATERVWVASGTSPVVAGTPTVDTSATISLDGAPRTFVDAVDFSAALGTSEEAAICHARQLFEFGLGRKARTSDSCSIKPVVERVMNGSMKDAWVALGLSQEFRYRLVAP